MALAKGKIITVTSVKGGVGKTTFLLSLASTYAKEKKRVLIIDMDLFSGDIAAILNAGIKKDLYTIYEDITNNNFYGIDSYLSKINDNIDLIAAPKDPRYAGKINSKFLNLLFSKVSSRYDVILIDTNHFLNEVNLVTFDNSNEILYILNNNSMNLKSMRTMISIFADMKLSKYKIILYEARDKEKMIFNKFDIRNLIKDNIDYVIPSDFYVKDIDKYIVDGKILNIVNKKNSEIYKKIAGNLLR